MNQYSIYKRCEDFAVNVIQLAEKIPYRYSVGVICKQVIRSSSSVGANLNEADNARSEKEFISCLSISLKEIRESLYWVKLLQRTNTNFKQDILAIEKECVEIKNILGRIYWIKVNKKKGQIIN